jgi:hypothetical protein
VNLAFLKRLAVLLSLCLITGVAFAGSVTVPFPAAGDPYTSATNGNGTIPAGGRTGYQWTTGDSVTSPIFSEPLTSVTGLTENWTYNSVLDVSETWNIYVNSIQVGSEVLNGCGYCGSDITLTNTFSFAGIAPVSGGYQIELILQNTVPQFGGSVAWYDGGTTTLSDGNATPEPGTMALLGIGLIGAGFIRRRK